MDIYTEGNSTLDLMRQFLTIVYESMSNRLQQTEAYICNTSWKVGNWQFTTKENIKKKNQIALTKNKLMLIIAQSLQHQYFSMGNAVVKILNGIIEGQSSSTNIQFVTHQMFLNQYYDKLSHEGEMQLCQPTSISTAIFVDDLINLEGQLHDKPEIYKGKFKIE